MKELEYIHLPKSFFTGSKKLDILSDFIKVFCLQISSLEVVVVDKLFIYRNVHKVNKLYDL